MPGQCRCIFLQNTALKNEFRPQRAKTKPRGCKITKIWPYMAPKGAQIEPKGHQNEPKGCQKGPNLSQKDTKMSPEGAKGAPKVGPKATKKHQKLTTSKKVDFGRVQGLSFGLIFYLFLIKNASKNRCEKRCQKKLHKTLKWSKKQGTIPPRKIKILTFLLQMRFLQNNVFTLEKQRFLKIPCLECVHAFEKRPKKK